ADAVAEILLLRLSAHVGEWQHADRETRGCLLGGMVCSGGIDRGTLRRVPLARDGGFQGAQQFLARPARGIIAPAVEVDGVNRPNVERKTRRLESRRDEDAAIGCLTCFAAD